MSGGPLAAKMKCVLPVCCFFFSVLALAAAGELEDSDGLYKTFQFHFSLIFSICLGLMC